MSTPAPARIARLARREWGPLYAAVRDGVAERRWRAVPMTLAAVCLTALLQFTQNQPWGYQFVQNIGSVRAEDPLWLALLRTPLSLFVPALDLPVWGALAQILLVFGIAEICVGWWRTLAGRLRRHPRGNALRARGHRVGRRTIRWGFPRPTRRSSTPGPRPRWWGSRSTCAGATGPG